MKFLSFFKPFLLLFSYMKLAQSLSKEALLANENSFLKEQLEWFKRQLFGKKSEKTVRQTNSQQLEFEGFDKLDTTTEQKEINILAHKRVKSKHKGEDKITLSADLPVETTILDLPQDKKVCPLTGLSLVKIGEEITHKLALSQEATTSKKSSVQNTLFLNKKKKAF